MSGYEKSPDYGGPDPKPFGWVLPALLFVLITALVFACQSAAKAKSENIIGVASVIDGDTIEIHGQRIRLWGIDAPESRQYCTGDNQKQEPAGRKAAFVLSDMLGSKTVSCEDRGTDRYRRMIGQCSVASQDISATMVERGWARAFVKYSSDYLDQESEAHASKRGMWAWTCEAPWDWRAARR